MSNKELALALAGKIKTLSFGKAFSLFREYRFTDPEVVTSLIQLVLDELEENKAAWNNLDVEEKESLFFETFQNALSDSDCPDGYSIVREWVEEEFDNGDLLLITEDGYKETVDFTFM